MAKRTHIRRHSLAIAAATGMLALAMPTAAQAPSLAMLDQLQAGEWQIRFRDGAPSQRICVRNGRDLIQLRHRQAGCNRFVVEDGANAVTVQYTCPGNGYGRTNIRRESGVLVQIASQGIESDRPFSFTAEGRRTRACP